MVQDLQGVGVAGLPHPHDVLLVLLLDQHGLPEEGHLGLVHLDALPAAQGGLRVEVGRRQGHGQALVGLDPLQVQAHLLPGREQALAEIRLPVAGGLRLLDGNRLRAVDFSQPHVLFLLVT